MSSKYRFVCDAFHSNASTVPTDYHFLFDRFLYNESIHLRSQPCAEGYTCYLLNDASKTVEARFSFFIESNLAYSPYRAPFGSIEFNPHLSILDFTFFLDALQAFLQTRHIQSLRIIGYPQCYAPQQWQALTFYLLTNQYTITHSELNFHLPVGETQLEKRMHPSEKRRLKKCLRAGFVFEENTSADLLPIYEFIRESRRSRGYTLSLDWDGFQRLFQHFPEACKVFSVKDQERSIAMTVAILVNQSTLYNFYPASDLAYGKFSPTVLLTQEIYRYCQEKAIRLLDLGTAMLGPGKPNYGLMRFKQNLGAQTSLKLSFEKVF